MSRLTLNYFKILFLMTALPSLKMYFPFIPNEILGFKLTGWAWLIVLFVSINYLFIIKKIYFPVIIWLPWIIFLLIYVIVDFSLQGLQLTLQYLVSIIVGWVVSGLYFNKYIFMKVINWFKYLIFFLGVSIIYFLIKAHFEISLSIGMAEIMTFNVAAVLVLSFYFIGHYKKAIYYYLGLLFFPVIQITRMGIVMMLAIAPLHFANKKIRSKIFMSLTVLLIGVSAFYTERFQKKTFFSGKGDLSQIIGYENNQNFDTSGRDRIYESTRAGIKDKPLLGHGPRADLDLFTSNGEKSREIHNDYLSIQYNYGNVGLSILLLCFIFQFIDLFIKRNKLRNVYYRIAILSSLTLFISFFGFMSSDNILKYNIYFGNFHFALMGISYALLNTKKNANIRRNPII